MSHTIAEQEQVIKAVLRVLSAEREDPHAHSGDEQDYAGELLALAARGLTRAVEALPADKRPVGWDREET